jgi:CBS domain-containing protein
LWGIQQLIVGYIPTLVGYSALNRNDMKVSDILRVKGGTLFTITPEDTLADAAKLMAEKDIGSLVVISHGRVVGMLTFREVIQATVKNGGAFGTTSVYRAMDSGPLICTMETEMDQVRHMMLERHARYMPVMNNSMLMGVISFYDVAKTVVDSQNFENKMLKAYIRDWPEGDEPGTAKD